MNRECISVKPEKICSLLVDTVQSTAPGRELTGQAWLVGKGEVEQDAGVKPLVCGVSWRQKGADPND